ncbi:MAG: Ig-like domain-containing protein, partial [Pirellulales bacterium]
GNVTVDLYATNGQRLATGASAANADAVISNFVDATSDGLPTSYFVAVSGLDADYSLIVTRDADFERELNDDLESAIQDITRSGTALGALSGASLGQDVSMGLIQDTLPWGRDSNRSIAAELGISVTSISSSDLGAIDLSEFDVIVLAGEQSSRTYSNVVSNMAPITTYVESGGVWVVNFAAAGVPFPYSFDVLPGADGVEFIGQTGADINVLDPTSGLITGPGGTIDDTNLDGGNASTHGFTASSLPVGADAILSATDPLQVVAFDYPLSRGRVIVHTIPVEFYDGGPHPIGQVFHRNLFAFATLESDSSDFYTFEANQGDSLAIETAIPGDGPGEFVNELRTAVELFDPTGALVASASEGLLTHEATSTGSYSVRVATENDTAGEYVLHVTGQTGSPPSFGVLATTPADGALLGEAPAQITVDFSAPLLLTTLDASDLTIDGVSATQVTVVDGDTAIFDLPALADGEHQVAIAGTAIRNLRGQEIEAFGSSFTIDTTAPRVVATSVQQDDSVSVGGDLVVTVQFDEPLDAGNLDGDAVHLLGQTGGERAASELQYDPTTSTLTLQFASIPEDTYTLTLFSGDGAFEDLVGNDLDGEPLAFPIPPNTSGDGV